MSLNARVITLDGSGAGQVTVPPCFYEGASGCTSVQANGIDMGTAYRTRGNGQSVVGAVSVSGGTPSGEAVAYFNFD